MIIADGKVEDEEIETVSNIYNKLTNKKKFSKNQIEKTLSQLKKSKKGVNEYLKEIRPYLNSGHRELVIKAMYYVAASDGHLDEKEGGLLMETATLLEILDFSENMTFPPLRIILTRCRRILGVLGVIFL